MRILITQGEARGIGPEIVVKALGEAKPEPDTEFRVVGDPAVLAAAAAAFGRPAPEDPIAVAGASSALAALEEAARRLADGRADAVVTAPVNKARLREAGFGFPGQTEFFAARLGAKRHAMMLAAERLRVVPATKHLALSRVPAALTREGLAETIRTVGEALRLDLGVESPRIAVLGLNPHAGEEGHFGDEEDRVIRPAIADAAGEGLEIEGPLPADAAFLPRRRDRWDAIVGAYHDQVLAPFKALTAGAGVNVTLGLPAVRTSPDHGTAEDIAGRGVADASSMVRAILLAEETARRRFLGRTGSRP